ncbi:MAG: Preprotein translocase [Parcubacteria group bacterium GW2011_GWA2_47_8]|nr:MAG: Preprotein translocase [Parcubacteria group bacterium GW2011_GWA2_47_8]OHB19238.1 MAG: preprotein translocase subunit SecE [Parcubacteria group bacterium RIFCSPHIGHO2_01_FULL_47_10b]
MNKIFQATVEYLKASRAELSKVQWPGRDETIKQTGVVIAMSIAVAALLGILDFVFQTVLQFIV